jgi:hypothetical protein
VAVPSEKPDGRLVRTWQRRYECQQCGAVVGICAEGVLQGFVYTLMAILSAWLACVRPPMGDGLDDKAVYAVHGVDRLSADRHGRKPRWFSLERWADIATTWWPTRAVPEGPWRERIEALLAGFLAGGGGRDGTIARAVAAHTTAGSAM